MSVEMNTDKTEKNESSTKPEPESVSIPGYDSFEQFTKEGFKTLVEAIRHSNALPSGSDWTFYKTHESFTKIMDNEGNTIQKLINSVLRKNDIKGSIRNRIVEDATELIVEANDTILEKVANNIDEMNGIKKTVPLPIVPQVVSAQLPINGSWNRVNSATFSVSSSIPSNQQSKVSSIRLLTAKNIVRPQKFFKDKICNSSEYPWEPRIKEKPNSLKPLAIFLEETEQGNEYSHPYEYELERFTPPNEQLQRETPLVPKPVTETELVEVETAEQLDQLLEDLRKCKIFAVDLEHHSYRSFMGITCLMQISTHEKDYLIDTLALRDKLYILNEVFTKPSIIKVFHGADMDIRWLQRDLSLYVVNMFDTYQASKALEYSQLSLAYLLQRFCNFTANKQFQLADWRIRPLPEELKSYAREDTHYLIYIYQKLKCELIDKANGQVNLVKSVFERSTETCLLRYFKPVLREDSYMDFYRKCKRMFDNRQLYALKELYKWRDQISREEDESTGYVLPNHMLLQISESLPREMQGILACCNPIPPLVKAHLMTLHNIILQARDRPLNKPILQEDTRARGQTKRVSKINVDSPLNCPHDLTKSSEFRDDLTTLLGKEFNLKDIIKGFNEILSVEQVEPSCSVFGTPIEDKKENKSKLESIKFLGPFERYKLVKPFIKAEEEAEAARKAAEAEKAKETQETESQPQEPNTEKTDAQRIESIRDHFLTLNRQTEEQNRSLIEMGGSKKRKREEDDEDDDYQEQTSLPEKYASTPAPLPHNAYRNFGGKNRKRKSGDNLQGDAKHFKGNSAQDSPQKTPNKKRKRGKKGKIQPTEQNETQPHPDQPKNRGRFNRGRPYRQRGSHNDRPSDQGPSTEDFSAYDYASVDYRQFQGGAGSVQNPREFKSTFKTRGKKKGPGQNKRFNQSQTFGSNFRGRGRGRGRGR